MVEERRAGSAEALPSWQYAVVPALATRNPRGGAPLRATCAQVDGFGKDGDLASLLCILVPRRHEAALDFKRETDDFSRDLVMIISLGDFFLGR